MCRSKVAGAPSIQGLIPKINVSALAQYSDLAGQNSGDILPVGEARWS